MFIQKEAENIFLRRVYLHGIRGSNTRKLRQETWPYLINLLDWDEDLEIMIPRFKKLYDADFDAWKKIESKVIVRDEEAFTAGNYCPLSQTNKSFSRYQTVTELTTTIFCILVN